MAEASDEVSASFLENTSSKCQGETHLLCNDGLSQKTGLFKSVIRYWVSYQQRLMGLPLVKDKNQPPALKGIVPC